jgi:alpha-D-ribose 1-methylphosphonate 5-triphosphate diphosphatase PhnM
VKTSQLYNLFIQSRFDEAKAIHLIGLLGVYDHTPSQEKKRKLKEFLNDARELEDVRTEEFLKIVSERFQKYLNK